MPDIIVEDPTSTGSDSVLNLRESDLGKHLINDKQSDDKADFSRKPKTEPKDNPETSAPAEFGAKDDYQLNQALNLLKGISILQGK